MSINNITYDKIEVSNKEAKIFFTLHTIENSKPIILDNTFPVNKESKIQFLDVEDFSYSLVEKEQSLYTTITLSTDSKEVHGILFTNEISYKNQITINTDTNSIKVNKILKSKLTNKSSSFKVKQIIFTSTNIAPYNSVTQLQEFDLQDLLNDILPHKNNSPVEYGSKTINCMSLSSDSHNNNSNKYELEDTFITNKEVEITSNTTITFLQTKYENVDLIKENFVCEQSFIQAFTSLLLPATNIKNLYKNSDFIVINESTIYKLNSYTEITYNHELFIQLLIKDLPIYVEKKNIKKEFDTKNQESSKVTYSYEILISNLSEKPITFTLKEPILVSHDKTISISLSKDIQNNFTLDKYNNLLPTYINKLTLNSKESKTIKFEYAVTGNLKNYLK